VTVAKLGEAEVLAGEGIDDILVAFPIIGPRKVHRLVCLAERARVRALVDSVEGARGISEGARGRGIRIGVLLEIEAGASRTGVSPGESLALAREVSSLPGVRLDGILTFAGKGRKAADLAEVEAVGRAEGQLAVEAAALLRDAGFQVEVVSVGSTPTAPYAARVKGVTEIRPGNYVFNDAGGIANGVASPRDCALTVLCTVVSRPTATRVVVDAGLKALTSDVPSPMVTGYGLVKGDDLRIERLSEEHGVFHLPPGRSGYAIGSQLEIIPNHSCTVANLFDQLHLCQGDEVLEVVEVSARGRSQ